jgi:hypothetical protein
MPAQRGLGQGPIESTITFGEWAEANGWDREGWVYEPAEPVVAPVPRVNFASPGGRKVA